MEQDTTRSLSKKLQSIRDDGDGEAFIRDHSSSETLHGFLNSLMAAQEITIPELIDMSGISRNYMLNYIEDLSASQYADIYMSIRISPRIQNMKIC